jgi:hypothetical protein
MLAYAAAQTQVCAEELDERQCDGPGSLWEDGICLKRFEPVNFDMARAKCAEWRGGLSSLVSPGQSAAAVELLGGLEGWVGLFQSGYNVATRVVFPPGRANP